MKFSTYSGLFVASLIFSGCVNSDSDSSQNLDNHNLVNLGDVVDNFGSPKHLLDLSQNINNSTQSSSSTTTSVALKNGDNFYEIIDNIVQNSVVKKTIQVQRGLKTVDTYSNRTYGGISGYFDMDMSFDDVAQKIDGSINYVDYLDEYEIDECSGKTSSAIIDGSITFYSELDENEDMVNITMSGELHISEENQILDIYIKVNGNDEDNMNVTMEFLNDFVSSETNLTIKRGCQFSATQNGEYEDDLTLTVNCKVIENGNSIELEELQYIGFSKNGLDYSYPISGYIGITSSELNGYFKVDENYDHSLTPTISQTENCLEIVISGEEHYIGESSSIIWKVDSENICLIHLDRDGDGKIDDIINDECN